MSVPAAALPKLPFAVLAGILALQAGLLFDLAGRSSATIDEEVYINAGVDQIVRGSHYSNPEHPPFAKDLIGLAVVGHDPHAGADRSQPIMETTMWSKAPAARKALLRSARMPSMGLALLTSVVAFWGATLLAGLWAGCIAAALFAFSPVALGHGSMATLDATVTCMTTLALVSSYQAWQLRSVQWRRLGATVAGIYLGAALGTKLSALYTLPVLFCACAYGGYRRRELRSTVVFLLIGLAATAVTLWAAHHFSVSTVRGFPVPMNRYFKGLDFQLRHAEMGHLNYLWGEVGTRGWWHYFIVGLAVKIPHPVQILFVLSALSLFLPDPEGGARRRKWALAMAFPTFLFAAMSFASTVQIGVKYLLPAAPLAHIAIAGGAMTWTRFLPGRLLVTALTVLAALAPFRVHPHELMFYNTLAGGPELGWRYTVHGDDLGQDQNQLGEWMAREGIEEIAYAQYSARPDHFGIQHRKLPCQPTAGVAAVHVIELVRPSWSRSRCFKWLEGRRPDEKVGYTIFIYRISQAEVDALRFRAPRGKAPLEKWGDEDYIWTRRSATK